MSNAEKGFARTALCYNRLSLRCRDATLVPTCRLFSRFHICQLAFILHYLYNIVSMDF